MRSNINCPVPPVSQCSWPRKHLQVISIILCSPNTLWPGKYSASWRCCYRLSGHVCGAIVSHLSLNEQVLCWGLTNIEHHAHCTGTRTRAHIHGPSSVACMLGGVTISFCSGSLYHRKGNRWRRWERASRPVFVQRSGVSSKPPAETVDRWKKSFTDSQVPRKRAVGL